MARPGALGAPSRGRCGAALAQGGWARFDPGDVPPPPTTDGPMCGSVLFIMKEHSCDDGGEARTAGRGRKRRRAAEAAAHAAHAVLWGASGRPELRIDAREPLAEHAVCASMRAQARQPHSLLLLLSLCEMPKACT